MEESVLIEVHTGSEAEILLYPQLLLRIEGRSEISDTFQSFSGNVTALELSYFSEYELLDELKEHGGEIGNPKATKGEQ